MLDAFVYENVVSGVVTPWNFHDTVDPDVNPLP